VAAVGEPAALVDVGVGVVEDAAPGGVVVGPLAAEDVAVGVLELAVAVLLARRPVANVAVALRVG
jgi:hypothetical protein